MPTGTELTAILICPRCTTHQHHTLTTSGAYRCQACGEAHVLKVPRVQRPEPEPCWYPTCRAWVNWWAPVGGRQQCRRCLGWVAVGATEGGADER